ncbi:MAG: aminomethyl-transferring glycine dehydrogenase subunit GcvPA [Proteobacteria bacterium]|nr:aminomethyl-transferring glycine dehydrogenase subunit GcvPA [Pseudomonadota bacterium]
MRDLPHTEAQIAAMLAAIGAPSVEALFEVIPEAARFRGTLDLPAPLSEPELRRTLQQLGRRNTVAGADDGPLPFIGAGLPRHAIPAAVDGLAARGEFATAYTPYQAEVSQGTLAAIFEFQTIVCELFATDYANASMYDGASATAEALLMARRLTGRPRALLAAGLHPEYLQTCRSYLSGLGDEVALEALPSNAQGGTDLDALQAQLGADVACLVVQTPSFFGVLEDLAPLAAAAHAHGALLVAVCTEPLALGLLQAPGRAGADIVVGEGLGLAGPPSCGGPGVGLFGASGAKALRQLPGRLVGETVDVHGRTGYVLTLSTREQHIRRAKATSNICTNHALIALRFTIHLALLGRQGLRRLAALNLAKTVYAQRAITALPGFSPRFAAPFFNEFAVRVPGGDAAALVSHASRQHGIVPGVALGRFDDRERDTLLIGISELHRREDLDRLVAALHEATR